MSCARTRMAILYRWATISHGLEIVAGDDNHIPLSVVLLSPVTAALTLLMIPDMMILWNYEIWGFLFWWDWESYCRVELIWLKGCRMRRRWTLFGYLWYWHSIIHNEVKHTKPGKRWRDTVLTSFTIWQDPTSSSFSSWCIAIQYT